MAKPVLVRIAPTDGAAAGLWHGMCVAATFLFVLGGWMIFRAESLAHLGALVGALGSLGDMALIKPWLMPMAVLVGPLVLIQIVQARTADLEVVLRWPVLVRAPFYTLVFIGLVLLGEDFGDAFIYFQF